MMNYELRTRREAQFRRPWELLINTVYCHVQCLLRYLHLRKSGLRSIYSIILIVRVGLSVEKKAVTAISELFIAISDRNISDIDFSSRRAGSEFELMFRNVSRLPNVNYQTESLSGIEVVLENCRQHFHHCPPRHWKLLQVSSTPFRVGIVNSQNDQRGFI